MHTPSHTPPQSPRTAIMQHHQSTMLETAKTVVHNVETVVEHAIPNATNPSPLTMLKDEIKREFAPLREAVSNEINEKILEVEKKVVTAVVEKAKTIVKDALNEQIRETKQEIKDELQRELQKAKGYITHPVVEIGAITALIFYLWFYTQ